MWAWNASSVFVTTYSLVSVVFDHLNISLVILFSRLTIDTRLRLLSWYFSIMILLSHVVLNFLKSLQPLCSFDKWTFTVLLLVFQVLCAVSYEWWTAREALNVYLLIRLDSYYITWLELLSGISTRNVVWIDALMLVVMMARLESWHLSSVSPYWWLLPLDWLPTRSTLLSTRCTWRNPCSSSVYNSIKSTFVSTDLVNVYVDIFLEPLSWTWT